MAVEYLLFLNQHGEVLYEIMHIIFQGNHLNYTFAPSIFTKILLEYVKFLQSCYSSSSSQRINEVVSFIQSRLSEDCLLNFFYCSYATIEQHTILMISSLRHQNLFNFYRLTPFIIFPTISSPTTTISPIASFSTPFLSIIFITNLSQSFQTNFILISTINLPSIHHLFFHFILNLFFPLIINCISILIISVIDLIIKL